MADFQAQSDAFLSWFQSQPGSTFHSSLSITDLRSRNAGRGIIATAPIPADTELFSIPRSSIISVADSQLSKLLPQIFTTLQPPDLDSDEIVNPDPWLDLVLVLMYEYLQGDSSKWKPYFDVLPNVFDTLMFWSQAELDELQASAVKDKIGKESANEMFSTKVLPVIKEHSDVFYPKDAMELSDEDLMTLAHRMGSLIMAYAFDMEADDSSKSNPDDEEDGWEEDREGQISMGMVPMADMLNADAEFNAHLNHGEDKLSMMSIRPIAAGEEVLNYYGPLPNSDLLRRYGYTSAKHSRYDVVEMSWDVVMRAIKDRHRGEALGELDEEDMEDAFVLERDAGEPDDQGRNTTEAQFNRFPEELQSQVYQVIAPCLGLNPRKKPRGEEEEHKWGEAFNRVMARALTMRLEEYKQCLPEPVPYWENTISQDEELLQKDDIKGRLRMAIEVRLGEKKLLNEASISALATLKTLGMIEAENKKDEERAAKRQKR